MKIITFTVLAIILYIAVILCLCKIMFDTSKEMDDGNENG